jgi:hypothetical protein
MNTNTEIAIIVAIFLTTHIISFLIGLLWCRLLLISSIIPNVSNDLFVSKKHKTDILSKKPVDIDERTVVMDIKTDSLEKKYQELGDITKSEENIAKSINKLKNMKG